MAIAKKSVFDIKEFDNVTIGIEYQESPAFTSLESALAFYGNNEAEVLKALNEDKANREYKQALNRPVSEFHTFEDEDETVLNGPADIQPANDKVVNDLVLNLAKQHYGFSKDASREAKQAAKAKAREFIRSNEALRQALVTMSSVYGA